MAVKALVKLANRLDEIGLTNLADDLDKILASTISRTPTTNLKKIACIIAPVTL